jgi:ornithine--oxo-acid transaminase
MSKINMTSRGFFNEVVASAENLICKLFKYEKVLLMNSKIEAEQTAIEIGRRWGHKEKNIATDKTKIVFANRNSRETSSHDNESLQNNSHEILEEHYHSRNYLVDYGNFEQIKEIIEKDSNICAVFMEPIQVENGVNIPEPDYFDQLSKLCKKHDVLLIMDETQTGLGRTGYLLCSQMHKVIPDIVLLGETLCGGIYPISAVITTNKIMDKIKPYDYISTYETNPLAAIISTLTIEELFTDSFITNSFYRGIEFGVLLKEKLISNRFIKEVRGRGLIYAIELWPECGYSAYDFSLWFLERGILTKPSNNYTLK